MNWMDNYFFIVFPYIAISVFLIATIYRYATAGYGLSSYSAQFLESKYRFWGIVPFHFGILLLFVWHLFVCLFPEAVLAWNSNPIRLIIHEGLVFTFGISVLFGLTILILLRLLDPRLRAVSSHMDIIIELLLLSQIVLGCWIALGYRWGSSWFAADLAPYLWSLVSLKPQITAVSALPLIIKLHIIGAFTILLLFPFTRLMHLLVAPFHYILRPYQVVIWNWDKNRIRHAGTEWSRLRPRNN